MPMRIESPRSDVLLQGKVAEATNEPIFIVRTKESSGVAVKKNAKLHKRMSDVEMQAVTQAQLVRLGIGLGIGLQYGLPVPSRDHVQMLLTCRATCHAHS